MESENTVHFTVNSVKNVDTRIERALRIAQRLRETKGVVKANEFWGG